MAQVEFFLLFLTKHQVCALLINLHIRLFNMFIFTCQSDFCKSSLRTIFFYPKSLNNFTEDDLKLSVNHVILNMNLLFYFIPWYLLIFNAQTSITFSPHWIPRNKPMQIKLLSGFTNYFFTHITFQSRRFFKINFMS